MIRHYAYLIVGGGMTGDAAARGIRQVDASRPIGMLSAEPNPPYNRPPLSKGLWKKGPRQTPLSHIWRGTEQLGVDLYLSRRAIQLDASNKAITDDRGDTFTFDTLLLATGGDPIRPWPEHARLVYFRTLADYHRLRALAETGQHFLVIGGGFIGSEMAAALIGQEKQVTIIFPEAGIGARVLPEAISQHLNGLFQQRGARVLSGQLVTGLVPEGQGIRAITDQGDSLYADGVVAGLGIRPNQALAERAGLAAGDGILVDPYLRTNHPAIFAAGDAARFYSPALDLRMRVEHEENANLTGLFAGQGMAGQLTAYEKLPSVYSSLFDINYDAVGELDPRLDIIYDWQEPFRKGAAYYLRQGRVRGVLLWNQPRGLDRARQVITGGQIYHPQDLMGLLSA